MSLIKISEEIMIDTDRIVAIIKSKKTSKLLVKMEGGEQYHFDKEDGERLWLWANHWAMFDLTAEQPEKDPFMDNQ